MKRVGCIFLFLMLCVTGCGATELEERCFPMVVGIGYENEEKKITYVAGFPRLGNAAQTNETVNEIQAEQVAENTFLESKRKYENHLNKEVDYNHLKVLVFEERLLKEKASFTEVITELAKLEEYPRNTYVCVVEEIEKLKGIEEKLPQDLGTYLEEYLNNHETDVRRLPTLGELMDEAKNHTLTVEVPVLSVKENYVEWNRNFVLNE